MTPENRKRLGEFLVLLIGVLFEAFGVWPLSHFWCLATTVVGVMGLLFLDGRFSENQIGAATSILVAIAAIIYAVTPPISPPSEPMPPETETHGWFVAANEPTPPNGCNKPGMPAVPADALLIVAGTNGAWTRNPRASLIQIGADNAFAVERDGEQIFIDANIYDGSGELVATVKRNEFHLISGKYAYQERSSDRSKITIYDKYNKEILYIDYTNKNTIVVRGKFSSKDGTRVVIDDDAIVNVSAGYGLIQHSCDANFYGRGPGILITALRFRM